MATLFMDNSQIYGQVAAIVDGMYADAPGVELATAGGLPCFQFSPRGGQKYVRKILPATHTTIFVAGRIQVSTLPGVNVKSPQLRLIDGSNLAIATLWVDTTGRIVVCSSEAGGPEIARTAGPVITANTFHFIEAKFVLGAGTGSVEVRVDDQSVGVIAVTNVVLGAVGNPISQLSYGANADDITSWWTDIHVWDTVGTRNINFLGDVRVSTLWPNQDVEVGWTPNYRRKIGNGILSNGQLVQYINGTPYDNPGGVYAVDSPSLQLGSADFTLECFIRFDLLPTGVQRQTIMGKWYEPTNNRSYQLSKCGPSTNSGNLEFRVSTDGTAGGVQTLQSVAWTPETNRWYHVAVVRASAQNMIFIDGIMQGVPRADAYAYFDDAERFTLMMEEGQYVVDHRPIIGNCLQGWMDEARLSHYARYLVNFTPTTIAFGRNTTIDPQFATVAFLAGFDNGLADESSYARTLGINNFTNTMPSYVLAVTTDDGFFQYQTINAEDTLAFGKPRDDTNISASFYRATGILTLTVNTSNLDTVTIQGQAYTFKTVLAAAYDVLIGASIQATLHNLAAAINQDVGSGTLYGAGTVTNTNVFSNELPSPQMQVNAITSGTAGNALTLAKSLSGSWSGTTLTGGQNIPGPSSFRFTRMPPDVTTVRSVMAVTRAYKTEAGPATMRTNFLGAAGTVALGSTRSLPVVPQYGIEIFEVDPDTAGPITPSTLVQGRMQFDRLS